MNNTEDELNKAFIYDELYPHTSIKLQCGELIQAAELSLIRGSEIEEHIQIADELTFVVSGKAAFYSNGELTELHSGQLHFIKKGTRHRIVASADGNFRYICIAFNVDSAYEPLNAYIAAVNGIDYVIVHDDGNIRRMMEMLMSEMYNYESHQRIMLNLYITQILISFYRILSGKVEPKRINKASSSFTLYHLLRYIDIRFMNIRCVKDIADELSYSEYYLSHLFKNKMGVTIKDYITEKKLSYAKELLTNATLSINEIADKLGYTSTHTFRQAFKRRYGLSPSECIESVKNSTRKEKH